MRYKLLAIGIILNLVIGITAYNLRPAKINYHESPANVAFSVPSNFPKPVFDFKNHPVTPAGFKLGRILFYDRSLSMDQSVSCASCHQSFAAFANLDLPVSHGVKQCSGTRNAPGLFNLAWEQSFMWDGGVQYLPQSASRALINPCEMAIDLHTVSTRLQDIKPYEQLFRSAFGKSEITPPDILNALTQFTAMLVSANSRYDKYMRKEPEGKLTTGEIQGYALFRRKCSSCHTEPLFTDHSYRNNGLDVQSGDPGRGRITHKAGDEGKFRVPSLRNVELTAPYMHDGRFATLEEVLAHYANGVKNNVHLDAQLKHDGTMGIALPGSDQRMIIAFLKTLTDRQFINNTSFQMP
jgi:cytochrome c peroxidase